MACSARSRRLAQIVEEVDDRLFTAGEIARRHGVSERTVYRDIEQLRAIGHKIFSGTGRGAGYMIRNQRQR